MDSENELGYSEAAKQQVSVLCSEKWMTKEDLIHDFTLPIAGSDPEAVEETRRLFAWAALHLDPIVQEMVEANQLLVQEGAYHT